MNWYYVDSGKQAGPVDDAQFESLRLTGQIQPDTLVWHEGMANWQPYSEVKPPEPPPTAPPSSPEISPAAQDTPPVSILCCVCGNQFAADQVIRHNNQFVCAACKPIFFQRLSEGLAISQPTPTMRASEAELLARDYNVDVSRSLSKAWDIFKKRAGTIIAASVLVYLVLLAINIIPYLSLILSVILGGPVMGGLWRFYIKEVRQEQPTISDAFSGFGPRFWQLVLTQLIISLVTMGVIFGAAIIMAFILPAASRAGRQLGGPIHAAFPPALIVPLAVLGVLIFAAIIYISTCWMFALPLAADKALDFWSALQLSRRIVSKHWWMTFWLLVACGVVAGIGVFGCVVGVLVTGPVAFAALACHYEKLFGDLAPRAT